MRNEKTQGAAQPAPDHRRPVAANTVRGQYAAGSVDGEAVPGYREEPA